LKSCRINEGFNQQKGVAKMCLPIARQSLQAE